MKKLKITFEENNKPKIKYKNYPRIDVNKMYSNSEDTIEQIKFYYAIYCLRSLFLFCLFAVVLLYLCT